MTPKLRLLLLLGVLAPTFALALTTVPGCGETTTIYPCADPIYGRRDHNGHLDECCLVDPCNDPPPDKDASADADDEPPPGCPGACIDAPALGWSDPALLWTGPAGASPPACPPEAPVLGFEGFADLTVPAAGCPACACTTPAGTCALPTGYTASSASCGAVGVTTSFNAPDAWDGGCTQANAVLTCGSAGCVASLTAGAITVQDESCAVATAQPAAPTEPVTYQTAARACKRGSSLGCDDPTLVCAPVSAAPPGFKLCVHRAGDAECPAAFPEKHGVATGVDDQRACSPCTCGSPTGGVCVAALNVFTDDACGAPLFVNPVSSTTQACFDIATPGVTLGSKSVDKLAYIPGACAASGGEPVGAATATGVSTFCCVP